MPRTFRQTVARWLDPEVGDALAVTAIKLATAEDQYHQAAERLDQEHTRAVWLQHELGKVQGQLRDVMTSGADAVVRSEIHRMLHTDKLDVVCMMGPSGCQSHFGQADCSVAMLRSWMIGNETPPQVAMLGLVMNDEPKARRILAEAIDEWCDRREAAAGKPGTDAPGQDRSDERHSVRLARRLAAAVRQDADV